MNTIAVIQWIIRPIPIWQSIFYFIIILLIFSMALLFIIAIRYRKISRKDILIFIEEGNRFKIDYEDIKGQNIHKEKDKTYIIKDPLLNSRGKALQIWTHNKPQPLSITHNKNEWLNADALTAVINNEIIKRLVALSSKMKDIMMMVGAGCSVVAALCSIVVLLIQLGVIKR